MVVMVMVMLLSLVLTLIRVPNGFFQQFVFYSRSFSLIAQCLRYLVVEFLGIRQFYEQPRLLVDKKKSKIMFGRFRGSYNAVDEVFHGINEFASRDFLFAMTFHDFQYVSEFQVGCI